MDISRRTALATGISAVSALAAGGLRPAHASQVRRIPSTGAAVPAVGLGSWITFNVGSDQRLRDRCAAVIAAFVDEGGGVIDCSPMYGSSQEVIGEGLARLRHPRSVFSAEKVWTSADRGPEQIAETAGFWRVTGFDLLQVHNLVDWRANLELLFAMKAAGQVRHVGITTSHGRRHETLETVMRREPLDFVQLTYNIVDREAERRLLPLARERGIAVLCNRPFQRGRLPQRLAGERLPDWAAEFGASTWPQYLLKFIIGHPAVTAAIPATSRVDHLRENKAAERGMLPDSGMRARMAAHLQSL